MLDSDKAKANSNVLEVIMTFKDLKKRVSLETAQQQSRLFERLQDRPFWIWDVDAGILVIFVEVFK